MLNRAENQNYVGPMPGATFYGPDGMSARDREKCYAWYNHPERENYVFDCQVGIAAIFKSK